MRFCFSIFVFIGFCILQAFSKASLLYANKISKIKTNDKFDSLKIGELTSHTLIDATKGYEGIYNKGYEGLYNKGYEGLYNKGYEGGYNNENFEESGGFSTIYGKPKQVGNLNMNINIGIDRIPVKYYGKRPRSSLTLNIGSSNGSGSKAVHEGISQQGYGNLGISNFGSFY